MRKINKSAEPESLKRYKRDVGNNDWNYMHKNHRNVFDECISVCKHDQHNICGYTEVRLNKNTHIDHFIKRAIDSTQTFVWENMIAAVHDSKFGADFKDNKVTTDDYDKARLRYHHILSPVTDKMSGRFRYGTDGVIESADASDTDAATTISAFNLNEESLVSRRRKTMQAVRNLLQGGMTKEEVKDYVNEFPSAVEYEISKY